MEMDTIPPRIFEIWRAPVSIDNCEHMIEVHKLQCSRCYETFDIEQNFAMHIQDCLNGEEKSELVYQLHMHANRHLLYNRRVALFCGSSDQPTYLDCGLCNQTFPDTASIRRHIRTCSKHTKEYNEFHDGISVIFGNMLFSHEILGRLFQQFEEDPVIMKIREEREQKREEEKDDPINLDPYGRPFMFDELKEYFIEEYQSFLSDVTCMMDDAFIRFLKRKNKGPITDDVMMPIPSGRIVGGSLDDPRIVSNYRRTVMPNVQNQNTRRRAPAKPVKPVAAPWNRKRRAPAAHVH
ncbi:hypothetical protein CAEBREN_12663 [Caenorhabditis brenneri]|uniref:C2H2-type domain-containing protein n=1 Tax=Caenorhabditis brenneri TaxID=135651 RepID=G0MAI6_CAEBE|nr:hypothetical protein CAEBREN_12663 [Caenorhabditis brenneri]